MSTSNLSLIRRLSISNDLTDDECLTLCGVMENRKLDDGEFLFQEGEVDNTLYGIARGRLEAVADTGGGEHISLQIFKEGDVVGELGFLDGTGHSAGVISIGESEVLTLKRDDLEALLGKEPKLVYGVMRGIVRTVHAILRRMNLQYTEMNNYISKQHGRY